MRAISSFPLRAVAGLGLLLGLHGLASASPTTEHATVCRSAGDQPFAGLSFDPTGATNASGGLLQVVCPVEHTRPVNAQGLTVWVDGLVPPGSSMTCALYSTDAGGYAHAGSRFNVSGASAPFDRPLSLPLGLVPDTSGLFVTCAMPANAVLFDIEPVFPDY